MKSALTSPFECCERTVLYAEYRHRSAIFIAHQPHDLLVLENQPLEKGGKKNWYFRYAVPVSKKRTKVSLGTYPHLTLAKARALRDEYLSLLANGIDPQVHNTQKANALKDATEHTFQAVAKKWLDEKVKTSGISQDHANDIWRSLERNIFPTLGDMILPSNSGHATK
ncbi:prophage integrase [Salmonella enterica subsp. enterica]|nr:prophage integrase [Salmonella enterica subsp. enterica]